MARDYVRIVRKKDRLRERLNALAPGTNEAINAANEKNAMELATAIKAAAPRDTGEYADSITAKPVDDGAERADQAIRTTFRAVLSRGVRRGQSVSRTARAVDTLAWGIFALYIWQYLEFGTQKQAGQPHIFPLYRAYRKRFRGRVTRGVNKAVKRVAKR